MKFHGDDINLDVLIKAAILKIVTLLTIILCRRYYITENLLEVNIDYCACDTLISQ